MSSAHLSFSRLDQLPFHTFKITLNLQTCCTSTKWQNTILQSLCCSSFSSCFQCWLSTVFFALLGGVLVSCTRRSVCVCVNVCFLFVDSAPILFNITATRRLSEPTVLSSSLSRLMSELLQRKGNVDLRRGWMLSGLLLLSGPYRRQMKWRD